MANFTYSWILEMLCHLICLVIQMANVPNRSQVKHTSQILAIDYLQWTQPHGSIIGPVISELLGTEPSLTTFAYLAYSLPNSLTNYPYSDLPPQSDHQSRMIGIVEI